MSEDKNKAAIEDSVYQLQVSLEPFNAGSDFDVSTFPASALLRWLTKFSKVNGVTSDDVGASKEFDRVVDELTKRDRLLRQLVKRSVEQSQDLPSA